MKNRICLQEAIANIIIDDPIYDGTQGHAPALIYAMKIAKYVKANYVKKGTPYEKAKKKKV